MNSFIELQSDAGNFNEVINAFSDKFDLVITNIDKLKNFRYSIIYDGLKQLIEKHGQNTIKNKIRFTSINNLHYIAIFESWLNDTN